MMIAPIWAELGRQSLRRHLSDAEAQPAEALEQIFASGRHDFAEVAAGLRELRVPRPPVPVTRGVSRRSSRNCG